MASSHRAASPQAEELALLVDAVQDYAIFLLGVDGEVRSWNSGAARIMGYSADEILGRPFSTFYTDLDRDTKPPYELRTAAAEGRVQDEGWRVRKDGRQFWASTVITALRNEAGELIGFAKVTRDLTERRMAEERLRQSEELFRLLVHSVRDYAIFMLDPEGRVATWNEGARRIKGYEAHEIIGQHFSKFYSEGDIRSGKPEYELRVAISEGSVEDEGWRLRKDGSRFWANVVITAVYDSHRVLRGFTKVTRDVTERKNAEEMREALAEQREARLIAEKEKSHAQALSAAAQDANRAKDEFLMTLSHELRTPMTAILGWARLLLKLPREDPMFEEGVASIARSAELQAQLIDDVLDVSRIVAGKLRLSKQTLDVEEVVRASVESVRAIAEARSVSIVTKGEQDAGQIHGDPIRLQQIIWNLLSNAVKFSPQNGTVEIETAASPSGVTISVRDWGEGIDPEFLPHMFEPFRQAENPVTRVYGGLGLGLSIVRHLVEAHGGRVTAESAGRGKGATFRVTLPAASDADQNEIARPEAENARRSAAIGDRLAGLRLMVIDDHPETLAFFKTVLQQAGGAVTSYASAPLALENYEKDDPDVILTDIGMPTIDGTELARRIVSLRLPRRAPVIGLSAFPGGPWREDENFALTLSKPVDPDDLVDAVAQVAGLESGNPPEEG